MQNRITLSIQGSKDIFAVLKRNLFFFQYDAVLPYQPMIFIFLASFQNNIAKCFLNLLEGILIETEGWVTISRERER